MFMDGDSDTVTNMVNDNDSLVFEHMSAVDRAAIFRAMHDGGAHNEQDSLVGLGPVSHSTQRTSGDNFKEDMFQLAFRVDREAEIIRRRAELDDLLADTRVMTVEELEDRHTRGQVQLLLSRLEQKEAWAEDYILQRQGRIFIEAFRVWRELHLACRHYRTYRRDAVREAFLLIHSQARWRKRLKTILDSALDKKVDENLRKALRVMGTHKERRAPLQSAVVAGYRLAEAALEARLVRYARISLQRWRLVSGRSRVRAAHTLDVGVHLLHLRAQARLCAWLMLHRKKKAMATRTDRVLRVVRKQDQWRAFFAWSHLMERAWMVRRERMSVVRQRGTELSARLKERGKKSRGVVMRNWASLARRRHLARVLVRAWYNTSARRVMQRRFLQWSTYTAVFTIAVVVQAKWRGYRVRGLYFARILSSLAHYRSRLPAACRRWRLATKQRVVRRWLKHVEELTLLQEADALLSRAQHFFARSREHIAQAAATQGRLHAHVYSAKQRAGVRAWLRFTGVCASAIVRVAHGVAALNTFRARRLLATWTEKAAIAAVTLRMVRSHKRDRRIRQTGLALKNLQYSAGRRRAILNARDRGDMAWNRRLFSYFFLLTQRLVLTRHRRRHSLVRGESQRLRWAFFVLYRRHTVRRRCCVKEWRCPYLPSAIMGVDVARLKSSMRRPPPPGLACSGGRLCVAVDRAVAATSLFYRNFRRRVVRLERMRICLQLLHVHSCKRGQLEGKVVGQAHRRREDLGKKGLRVLRTMLQQLARTKQLLVTARRGEHVYWRGRMRWTLRQLLRRVRRVRHLEGFSWVTCSTRDSLRTLFRTLTAQRDGRLLSEQRMRRTALHVRQTLQRRGLRTLLTYRRRCVSARAVWNKGNVWRLRQSPRLRTALTRIARIVASKSNLRAIRDRFHLLPVFQMWWCTLVRTHQHRLYVYQMAVSRETAIKRNILVHWGLYAMKGKRLKEQARLVQLQADTRRLSRFLDSWLQSWDVNRVRKLMCEVKRRRLRYCQSTAMRRWYMLTSTLIVRRRNKMMHAVRAMEKVVEVNRHTRSALALAAAQLKAVLHKRPFVDWAAWVARRRKSRALVARAAQGLLVRRRRKYSFVALHVMVTKCRQLEAAEQHFSRRYLTKRYGGRAGQRVPLGETVDRSKMREMVGKLRCSARYSIVRRARRLLFRCYRAWWKIIHDEKMLVFDISVKLGVAMQLRRMRLCFRVLQWRRDYKTKKRQVADIHRGHTRRRLFAWWHSHGRHRVVVRARAKRTMTDLMNSGIFDRERKVRLALARWKVVTSNGPHVCFKRIMRVTLVLWRKALHAGRLYRRNLQRRVLLAFREFTHHSITGRRIVSVWKRAANVSDDFSRRHRKYRLRDAFPRFALHVGLKPHSHDRHVGQLSTSVSRATHDTGAHVTMFEVVDVDRHLEVAQRRQGGSVRAFAARWRGKTAASRVANDTSTHLYSSSHSHSHHHNQTPHRDLHKRLQQKMAAHRKAHNG
jgi:hypothetical protein